MQGSRPCPLLAGLLFARDIAVAVWRGFSYLYEDNDWLVDDPLIS